MNISSIKLTKFRCFNNKTFEFNSKIVQILGVNGIGKTSLLESIYYSCYLRSFKTHIPKELANFDGNMFSIITNVHGKYGKDIIYAGFENGKKFAKINNKPITTFKEIHEVLKVITITQSDTAVIEGGPVHRRSFLDHAIILFDPEYLNEMAKYNKILKNRNSLFFSSKQDIESYSLWTTELTKISEIIQKKRADITMHIQNELSKLSEDLNNTTTITITYKPSQSPFSINDSSRTIPRETYDELFSKEYRYKRSLFGAHLDDLDISFNGKTARIYSSRGQQKLIIFLLKFAVIKHAHNHALDFILLIDDFFSDFDNNRSQDLLQVASKIASQIFITAPTQSDIFNNLYCKPQIINLNG